MDIFTQLCTNIKAIVPIVSLVSFVLAAVCKVVSLFLSKEKKNTLRWLAIGFLVGGLIGLTVAASVQFLTPISGGGIGRVASTLNTNPTC